MFSFICLALSLTAEATTPQGLMADLQRWSATRAGGTAPKITLKQIERAFEGEVVAGVEVIEHVKAGKGYALGIFDVPIETLWSGICDEDHHAGTLRVDRSETVEGTPRAHGRTLYQYLDVPVFSDRWWLVQMSFNTQLYEASNGRAWELTWVDRQGDQALKARLGDPYIAEGVGIAWAKGAWFLVKLDDNRTFVEYHSWSNPGGRVPAGPATRFAKSEVRDNLVSMVRFARTHGATCKGPFFMPDGTQLR